MTGVCFLGKLITSIGTGSSPFVFFGLSTFNSQPNREILLLVDYKAENMEEQSTSKKFYQDMPIKGTCVTNPEIIDNGYELVLKSGKVRGSNTKDYQIKGAWGAYYHGKRGASNEKSGILEDAELDKLGLMVLEFDNSIHFLLVVDTNEENHANNEEQQEQRKPFDIRSEGVKWTERKAETIVGKRISVSREIVGYWAREESEGQCGKNIKGNQQLFRNFGRLYVDELRWGSVKVLDWVVWGKSNIEKQFGWGQMNNKDGTVVAGKSWFWIKDTPKNAIVMRLKEAIIDDKGIKNELNNQIKWIPSFKPTITSVLEK